MTVAHVGHGAQQLNERTYRMLTPADVAERLAVSRSMAYKLLRTGELPAIYVGRLPRIAEADLDAFIRRRREPGR
jgi:excisionase family DNA binding protein